MLMFRRSVATAALAAAVTAGAASAQQTYPQTIYWGAGLIDIPVAWAAPLTGDFAINYSGKTFERDPGAPKINYSDRLNSQLTFAAYFFGRVEIGIAAYSSNPEYGWFGQALLLNEESLRTRGGAFAWIPSIAVGIRNVGPYDQIDRFGVGYRLLPPTNTNPNYQHVPDSLHLGFDTDESFYGVATKSFSLADLRPNWPDVNLSFSLGFGNGLFEDDGGLGARYASHETGGLFGGVKLGFAPTPNATVSVMLENNAWDYNAGASVEYRGLRAGLYFTELGTGGPEPTSTEEGAVLYNYSKVAFTLGWQSNVFALLRGDFLRGRVAELERRREALLAEIQTRQQRIASLELEINRYEAQNLLELEQRRAEAERQLREEREALQRLEERLRRIEQQQRPPANPPRR